VQTKEEQLKKAEEDMKFYKLELLNRENNYNKVFGAHPVVGMIDPLESRKPKSTKGKAKENAVTKGKGV